MGEKAKTKKKAQKVDRSMGADLLSSMSPCLADRMPCSILCF